MRRHRRRGSEELLSGVQVFSQHLSRDFRGAPDMLLVSLAERFHIFCQRGIADFGMFFMLFPPAVDAGDVAVALVLIVKNFVEAHQPG